MTVCLVGLGSNLGDRTRNLDLAVESIGAHGGIEVVAVSRYHDTTPIGGPTGQGDFLNAAARLRTNLSPEELMQHLLQVEHRLGRRRLQRWGPRIIDLDILLFGEYQRQSRDLRIPHPRMGFRRFVLQPAAEIAADMVHPEIGWTIAELLEHLDSAIPYIAVAGLPKAGKTDIAGAAADRCRATLIADPLAQIYRGRMADCDQHDSTVHREILDSRCRAVHRDGFVGRAGESISDFWVEQTLPHAETWLSDADEVRYREHHTEMIRGVVPPKLLVLIEISASESLKRLEKSDVTAGGWDEQRLATLERRLDELTAASRNHPVLRVSAENPSQAVDDVVAAIETMR